MTIAYRPIGVVHSPFRGAEGMPIQPAGAGGAAGTVEVFDEFADGLADLAGFSHVVLVYHFHRSDGYDLRVVPFLDAVPRGLFATRAPRRPNAIGISVVRLRRIEGALLHVENIDILDGAPLLDIKPHVPEFDAPGDLAFGWLEAARGEAAGRKSDDRFTTPRRPPGERR